jgi:hypothetical protein
MNFFLGAFVKQLRAVTTSLVQYVPLSAWNSATYTRGIFVKFHICDSYWNFLWDCSFGWNRKKTGRVTWRSAYSYDNVLPWLVFVTETDETVDFYNITVEHDRVWICCLDITCKCLRMWKLIPQGTLTISVTKTNHIVCNWCRPCFLWGTIQDSEVFQLTL